MLTQEHRVAELLTHLAGGLTEPIQATLQGPVHAVRYEAATEHNALGYSDREGFEGFAIQYAQARRRHRAVASTRRARAGPSSNCREASLRTPRHNARRTLLPQETKGMTELEEADLRGIELVSMLYTYRSIARALPTVTGTDAHKKAMYAASFEVLHPHFGASKAAHLLAAG